MAIEPPEPDECAVKHCGADATLGMTWNFGGIRVELYVCEAHFDAIGEVETVGAPEPMVTWVLLVQGDGGDYYQGEDAALYRDGVKVWDGSSGDAVTDIVRAILGDEVEVRRARWEAFPDGTKGPYHFRERLADQPEPKGPSY